MKEKSELTLKHQLGYALGDFGGNMTFSIIGTFLTRYYINVALIDTAVIAVMTLIWRIWDAFSNPIMGMLMDKAFAKSKNPKGKFRPWMLRAAPLLAITAFSLFTAPNLVDGASKLVVVFISYLLYEASYTMFNIPYGSLLSSMAGNVDERAKLSLARSLGGRISSTIPQVLFPLIITYFKSNPKLGYASGVTICAGLGFICCLLSYRFTEERYLPKATSSSGIKLGDIVEVFRKNRAFAAVCINAICTTATQSVTGALGTYMYSDVLGRFEMMSVGSTVSLVVSIFFMVAAPVISARMSMERMVRTSLMSSAAIYVAVFAMCMLPGSGAWAYMIGCALAVGVASLSGAMQWGLVGEAIDYNEYLTGKRTEGSIYGAFNMVRRLGQALGGAFGVAMLGLINYDVAAANMGLPQSESTVFGIKVLSILLPALFSIGSWAAFRYVWNITPEIREKIAARKSADSKQ